MKKPFPSRLVQLGNGYTFCIIFRLYSASFDVIDLEGSFDLIRSSLTIIGLKTILIRSEERR